MTDLQKAIEAKGLRLSPKAMEAALAGARHLRAEVAKITEYLAKDD
ncbi:hypothetical protein NX862_16645 [Rhodobacter sp. KR11]|jgi:hypothetical protein|nr:hypothetical protein [Rhodobacter sp. KR11]MCW1920392.1 hypothetical protein [Rhodobacter sp. KR11]